MYLHRLPPPFGTASMARLGPVMISCLLTGFWLGCEGAHSNPNTRTEIHYRRVFTPLSKDEPE